MASKSEKIEHLRNLPLLAGCSKRELEQVAKAGDEIDVPAGTLLVDQGQTGREAFVIMSGEVSIKRNGRKVASASVGDIVGEMSLLDHGPRTASAFCDTDCSLFVLDQRHFRGVLEEHPSITLKMLAVLAGRVRELDRQSYG
ncbi:MAG: cyclic nucleotide-binding domain-containing protein [Ilumatobacter sp.]|nr:cyclic nucleotide-binding domain-containing protein [Ilumatobacter sp.]